MEENNFLLETLLFVGNHIPDAIYLTKVEKKERDIYLYGRALSREEVVFFVKLLSEHFSEKKISINEANSINVEKYGTEFLVMLSHKK